MEEILFRGQRTDNKKWVYGYYTVFIEGIRKNHCIISENKDAKGLLDSKQIKYYVIPKTVGQFTGKYDDKNKRNVFEGDVYQVDKIGREIKFTRYGFYLESIKTFCNCLGLEYISCRDTKFLGNIFENPELVKG